MTMYHEVTVEVKNETERGTIKKQKEYLLVDSLTTAEAERRVQEDYKDDVRDWDIVAVKRSKIGAVIQ